MLKKIWQPLVRWFNKLIGRGSKSKDRLNATPLPPLDDSDREYLFMQLLEGVAHGWQQPRAIGFFNKIRNRVRKSEWLEWLDRFGQNLLESSVPNYELAGRMSQLAELDCGEVGDLAGEYAMRLLHRQSSEYPVDFMPIMEFGEFEPELLTADGYPITNARAMEFEELPPEFAEINNSPQYQQPRSFPAQAEEEDPTTETREITLEEFSAMLNRDPALVAELAEQFGIETDDPEVIISAVIAQMQQQVQPISGDLSASGDLSISGELRPPEVAPLAPGTPPPPPSRKLEYNSEDPWVPQPMGDTASAESGKSIETRPSSHPS